MAQHDTFCDEVDLMSNGRPNGGVDAEASRQAVSPSRHASSKELSSGKDQPNGSAKSNGQNGHLPNSKESHQDNHEPKSKDEESQQKPAPRSRFAAALQTFSPIWFAAVMNTGILGIIMHQNPLPYNGFWWQICSYILYITSLVLFVIFMLIFLLRAILYPKSVPGPGKNQDPISVETVSISACMPIASLTLIGQTTVIASAANWNGTGHGFMLFCYVAWWCVVVWILVTAQVALINATRKQGIQPNELPPAAIIPGVGVVTAALVGAVVVTYGYDVSPQLAIPVIIVGYILVGWGVFWAIMMYSVLLIRFLDQGWPQGPKMPTLLFLVGPPGQTAGALAALGSAAQKYFPGYASDAVVSPIFTRTGGESFAAISILFAFIFLGLYFLWLIYAIYGILEAVWRGELKGFVFTWWGTIFPTATGNLAFVMLAEGINSQAFSVLSCIWLVALFIDYFLCFAFTIKGIFAGSILDGRDEEEKERYKVE